MPSVTPRSSPRSAVRALAAPALALSAAFAAAAPLPHGGAPEDVSPSREEAFELVRPGRGGEEPAGWARWVRGHESNGTFRVELEFELFEHQLVLHQVERRAEFEQELIYRERRPGAGRTLRITWTGPAHDAVAERVEWVGRDRLTARSEGARPTTPLVLAEDVRSSAPPRDARPCYSPSADAESARHASVARVALPDHPAFALLALSLPRHVVWRDGRGDVLAWRLFVGGETLAFGFAPGGPVAVRTSPERLAELRAAAPR